MKRSENQEQNNIALALGGGGAKGLAHLAVLETIEENDLKVSEIAATSIGSVIAAFYASGMPAAEVKDLLIKRLSKQSRDVKKLQILPESKKWYSLIGPKLTGSSLLKLDGFMKFLDKNLPIKKIEDLQTPLKIVASDFWTREQVVFEKGDLLTAIQASISIAGLFEPVVLEKQVLVDGGAVNPVPFDLLDPSKFRIAVDVLGHKNPPANKLKPGLLESFFNTYQIMEESIVRQKLLHHKPEIYLKPNIQNIRVLDFHKHSEIFVQTQPSLAKLKKEIQQWEESKK